jgi:hypothetical protein
VVSISFSLYAGQQGGEPLWTETQKNIQLDATGHYSVQLGITQPNGVPTSLFTTGEARWLAVQIAEQPEQSRVLLVSVPYALKAGDAQTIGGFPPSAFVLAAPSAGSSAGTTISGDAAAAGSPSLSPNGAVTGSGTVDYIPLWNTVSDIVSSVLFQAGSGSTAKVGINNATPAATLDVKGTANLRGTTTVLGTLALPATGVATAAAGKNSEPDTHVASAYNSSTSAAVNQTFQWQAEPVNNDTSSPSGTLNLLFGQGTATPAETGLHIASNGHITFATGQTFPGTGDGTITGITTAPGSGLTGGGIGGTLTLGLTTACASNQVLQWTGSAWNCSSAGTGTITSVTAGTDLTGGGASGNVTLNLNTSALNSAYAQLTAANTFTGNQTVNGNLTATGVVTGSSYQIGNNLFAFGSYGTGNAFLGFAGNSAATGISNTGAGYVALQQLTTGTQNTAVGFAALQENSTAAGNTGIGYEALQYNSGYSNTATGALALYSNTFGSESDAFGYQTLYSNTSGSNNDAFGYEALYKNTSGEFNDAFGYQALFSNTTGYDNAAFGMQTLLNNTNGYQNTAEGWDALALNTTGYQNTATGSQALANNATAAYNTATGVQALYNNTAGPYNTATGYQALYSNTTANYNTANGTQALLANTTGEANLADGALALYSNTTGAGNTGVGANALYSQTTTNYATCVGYSCTASDNVTNATAIGAHARVGASNSLVLGGTGAYAVKVGIGTETPSNILTVAQGAGHPVSDSWETYSSRRWKTNIKTLPDALAKIEGLRGVSYDLKASGKHEIGVIAEEVGAVVPEVVSYEENGQDARSVDYSRLTALLIEAVKQQQKQIAAQQGQIRRQQQQLRTQQAKGKLQDTQMADLRSQIKAIRASLVTDGNVGNEISTAKAGSN